MNKLIMLTTAVLLVCASLAFAAVPPVISYQGKLMQSNGTPVPDGTYNIRFAIYDTPTGGEPLWSETNPNVQVKGGLFAILLGSVNNLGPNILDSQNRYLGIKVGDDAEMNPRQRIASVACALRAGEADVAKTVLDGAITTSKLVDGAVTTAKLADNSVASAKIGDSAVITAAIADSAVNNGKIASAAITTPKIANGAVTASKIEAQQAWIAPTLLHGWVNIAGSDQLVGYMKDSMGFVHVKGYVGGGSIGTTIFTLPVGYRPLKNHLWATTSCGAFGQVAACSDGSVNADLGNSALFSLACITFLAEQ